MNSEQLQDWLDRHHVHVLRMEGVLPHGAQIGRFVHRDKFARSLPLGCPVSDTVLASDLTGMQYKESAAGDEGQHPRTFFQRPDLATLITDGTDPDLGHCIVELVDGDGNELELCPRTVLRGALARLAGCGLTAEVGLTLEFNLFEEDLREARGKGYRNLTPLALSDSRLTLLNRNAYPVRKFMNELTARLEWREIEWDSWNVGAGPGKIALQLRPCAPLAAADRAVRTRHALYEVAAERALSVTFMAQPVPGNECSLRIEPVLKPLQESRGRIVPQVDEGSLRNWNAGQLTTRAAATALYAPSINAYRALSRLPALPLRSPSAPLAVAASADANPYLALATLVAAGIAGLGHELAEQAQANAPGTQASDPASLGEAIEALRRDPFLQETLGREFTRYWIRSRRWEEHLFTGRVPRSEDDMLTDWELSRYFELV